MSATASYLDGQDWKRLVLAAADAVEEQTDELSRLDAAVGDGDHGVNVATAMRYARNTLSASEDLLPGDVLKITAQGFLDEMGGAAGALFGSLFRTMGRSFGDAAETNTALIVASLGNGSETVMRRGQTRPGDKTMVDALAAATAAAADIDTDNASVSYAMAVMAEGARRGAESTTLMTASRGRAKYAGDKAVGVPDAGASTVAIILEAWAAAVLERSDG